LPGASSTLAFGLCLSRSDHFLRGCQSQHFFSVNCATAFCVGNVSTARTSPVATDIRMTIPSFMAQAVDAASNRVIEAIGVSSAFFHR